MGKQIGRRNSARREALWIAGFWYPFPSRIEQAAAQWAQGRWDLICDFRDHLLVGNIAERDIDFIRSVLAAQ